MRLPLSIEMLYGHLPTHLIGAVITTISGQRENTVIKRYGPWKDSGGWSTVMDEEKNGSYVKYEDYERIEALLRDIHPYLDALICYASTINEHLPNGFRARVDAALGFPVNALDQRPAERHT
jgi:hypothetical protein